MDEQTDERPLLARLSVPALVLVGGGGFGGATLRYGVALTVPSSFPWGTLAVNVAGCFALSLLLYERHLVDAVSAETRLLLGTGLLSSFTTYSTFAAETAALPPELAVANVAANYGLGLAAVVAGRLVTGWVV